jgi:hypothetical protein
MYQCSTWIYGRLARTPKYCYTYATKKIAIVPLRRGVHLIWLNSSKGGKILIHFFHNHVQNKVKSPHPHTTNKWVTAASHAPPPRPVWHVKRCAKHHGRRGGCSIGLNLSKGGCYLSTSNPGQTAAKSPPLTQQSKGIPLLPTPLPRPVRCV